MAVEVAEFGDFFCFLLLIHGMQKLPALPSIQRFIRCFLSNLKSEHNILV